MRVPDLYYLDTSVVTTAITVDISHHDAARDYCADLIRRRESVIFSELLRLEYAHHLRTVMGKLDPASLRRYGLHRWERESVRHRWIREGFADFDHFVAQFGNTEELALTRDIIDYSADLMIAHNLDSYDAAHVATALAAGATRIVTLDRQFIRARPIIDVHLIPDDSV